MHMQRGPEAGTESPHAAATPMMARVRKWTARCPAVGILSARVVVLVLVVLVFWFSVSLLATLGSGTYGLLLQVRSGQNPFQAATGSPWGVG